MKIGEEGLGPVAEGLQPIQKQSVQAWSSGSSAGVEMVESLPEAKTTGDVNLVDNCCGRIARHLESLSDSGQAVPEDFATKTVLTRQGHLVHSMLTRIYRSEE